MNDDCYFNYDHALQLRSETVAFRRRMIYSLDDIYDGHMITGDECGLNFLTFVLRLWENPGKTQPGNLPNQESNPGPLRVK